MKTSTRRFFSLGRRVRMLVVAGLAGDLQQRKNSFFKIFGFNKFVYLCLPKKSGSKPALMGKFFQNLLSQFIYRYLRLPP